jgi:hypothetical protein
MRVLRKDYRPIGDNRLDKLRRDLYPIVNSKGSMTLPAKTLYSMVMELIDSREEIFRLQLCETVDKIIASELDDDEEELLSFRWPQNDYMFGGEEADSGAYKPAFPCKETQRLETYTYPTTVEQNPDQEGRRLPRTD